MREVLGREFSPFDRSIDTHVCNLRRKLGPLDDGTDRIKGVRGAGYLYVASHERAVSVHGGTVHAMNAPGGGLIVEIRLPS